MFRFQRALTVVLLQTVFIVPNGAQRNHNEFVMYLPNEETVFPVQLPDSYFINTQRASYSWIFNHTNLPFFVEEVNITKLFLRHDKDGINCYDSLKITRDCQNTRGGQEMFHMCTCHCQCPLPAVWYTYPECNLSIVISRMQGRPVPNKSMHGFNATLTIASTMSAQSTSTEIITSAEVSTNSTESTSATIMTSTEESIEHTESSSAKTITSTKVSRESTESSSSNSITSTEESTESTESSNTDSTTFAEESSHSSNKSANKVILPVTLTILVILIIAVLLVLILRGSARCQDPTSFCVIFMKFRKTNENTMTGTSFTNSAYSQNEISTSTTLGKHDQVNGIFIERNGKPDQIEDKNLDHLEGEGVESNPVYVSGADDDQNKQEQAYQRLEPNEINKQHEYAYVDSESLRGRQTQMMSNGQTAPNTTSEVRHDQGEELGDQNDVSTKKTVDGNLDHLEGEGVEYNSLYVSDGEDDQKNKQEHTYQSIKRKDENKPHEYTYIDLESLKGRDK